MATEVKRDLLSGTQGMFDVNGWNFTVIFYVTGVEGATAVEKMANAINASGVPVFGTDLSAIDPELAGCWLRSKTAVPDTGDQFTVTLIYRQDRITNIETIESGASVNSVDTNIDIFGNTMTVAYQYPGEYPLAPELANQIVTQGGLVQKLLPEPTQTWVVREPISPVFFREFYENKVNRFEWYGGKPGEWLCTSINGFSDDGVNYKNSYSFQKRVVDRQVEDVTEFIGWQANVRFKDTKTGNPPSDLVKLAANTSPDPGIIYGDKLYLVYDDADFFDLFG